MKSGTQEWGEAGVLGKLPPTDFLDSGTHQRRLTQN